MTEKQGDGQKGQQMPEEKKLPWPKEATIAPQKKQMIRGVQLAEPYPTDYEMETLFNAWKSEGKAGLVKALDSLHPEGWASEETQLK